MAEPRMLTYREAVLDALFAEMRADPAVMIIGEDVGAAGGVFKQTEGLFAEFGALRVVDTPISEPGAFGMAVGAAMTGMRPVFEVMFGDFMTLCMDQLVNQAAKVRYMSNGRAGVPLVLRTTMGTGANLGPQHSQGFYAWAAHVPGLKVVAPATPQDAHDLMRAAIRDDDPVLFFEDRMLYTARGPVVAGEPQTLGRARVVRQGRDVTIVAIGRMVAFAQAAAEELAREGVEVEIVDPRTIAPLDRRTIIASVKRTHRALVVDGAPLAYGVTGEIASIIAEEAFDWLDAPVSRLGAANVPVPISRSLEPLSRPDASAIAQRVRAMLA
ncbi:MAG: alpha-ketoacid dehydrogenase subunit beta [Hyphomicrobiales bacterium]|nr:alpha-ketoacid dehydrogenase subunit beta [Hyphomicrobiales bacterium]